MIFLTEYRSVPDYILMMGENIEADSWEEAEAKADALCVEVVGELIEIIPCDLEEFENEF